MDLPKDIQSLAEAPSWDELKLRFRDRLELYGFEGFLFDRCIGMPMRDFGTWPEFVALRADDQDGGDAPVIYDDVAERYGDRSNDYFSAYKQASVKNLTDDVGIRIMRNIQGRRMPFLDFELADGDEWKARIRATHDIDTAFGTKEYVDVLRIPQVLRTGEKINICLPMCRSLDAGHISSGIALSTVYFNICDGRLEPNEPPYGTDTAIVEEIELRPKELEVVKWAAAGKTLQDIADITGMPYTTVRYHLNQARERYGYATNQQTIVRGAIDYRLDPFGPE
jgi:DNA-binding CsgD family transcriptional regulator